MPRVVFALTKQQRDALEALDWLYSPYEEDRRSGRTTVLAICLLRRLLLFSPSSRNNGWLDVEDHVSGTRELDRHLTREVLRIAHECGFRGIEVHGSGSMIRLTGHPPQDLIDSITNFEVMAELPDFMQPPPTYLPVLARAQRVSMPVRQGTKKPQQTLTLWKHLLSND